FLLSLSIDLHMASTAHTRERAIAGITHGIIEHNQTVTWRGRHFRLMLEHTSLIDRYDSPRYFRDVMIKGHFRSFEHEHFFEPIANGATLMRDRLALEAAYGPLGWLIERLILRDYFTRFLSERNAVIKRTAEGASSEWQKYLQNASPRS